MVDITSMLAETRHVLKEIPDWREALKSLARLARTNRVYRKEHHDIKREDRIWAILFSAKGQGDVAKDFKKVQEWTVNFLHVMTDHRGANVLWIDLGDSPELFEGRCFRTDPSDIELDPVEADAEVHSFPDQIRHTVFELSCSFWEEVADSDLYLPWLGFCALAVREALNRPKAREGLKARQRIYVTAGFEEPGNYIGTLTKDGYTFEADLGIVTDDDRFPANVPAPPDEPHATATGQEKEASQATPPTDTSDGTSNESSPE